jgi:hypothetical protein
MNTKDVSLGKETEMHFKLAFRYEKFIFFRDQNSK